MKALSLQAQWALPLLAGVKWIETRPRRTHHRGRTAVHISKAETEFWRIWHAGHQQAYGQAAAITTAIHRLELAVEDIEDVFGCVSGGVEVTECVPIVAAGPATETDVQRLRTSGAVVVDYPVCRRASYYRPGIPPGEFSVDVTDQLPYGDFKPGRYAVLTRSPALSIDRCPYCWGTGAHPDVAVNACQVAPVTIADLAAVTTIIDAAKRHLAPCPVCDTAGHCQPVPARGQQAVPWNWNPENS